MKNDDEKPLDASRLAFSAPAVVSLVVILVGLLGTAISAAWQIRGQLASIENKLDHVSDSNLVQRFYTRVEAARYHDDLGRTLRHAGVQVDFPPPQDPAQGPTSHD